MPISFLVPQQTTPTEEWVQVFGEAWVAAVGSYFPLTPSYDSDGGELALEVDGPWATDLIISKIRITFTGVASIGYFGVIPDDGPPQSTTDYVSGQEFDVNITPADPLYALYWDNGISGEFSVTSIEFLVSAPEPIDPETLDCTDYTDELYWDSTNTVGTYSDPNWVSVNSGGDDYIQLVPWGTTPPGSSWNDGYQPAYARILFTGPSTVDIVMQQKEPGGFEDFLISEEGYSSGDVLTVGASFFASSFKLSSIYIGNSPGTGTITVTGVLLCWGPTVCQEWLDVGDAQDFPPKYPAPNVVETISIMPGSYGALRYYPFVDGLTGFAEFTFYPVTVTSTDANNFTVTTYTGDGLYDTISTTGGTVELWVETSDSSLNPPLYVVIENEEVGSECDIFNVRFGTEIQDYSTSGPAMADPILTLTDDSQPFLGGESRYFPVGFTVAPNRISAVHYTLKSSGGYDVTVTSHNGSDNEFLITLWDGNMANPVNELSSGGVAAIYVTGLATDDFYVTVNQFDSNGRRSDFTIFYPQPF